MKKIFTTVVCCVMIFGASICFATVNADKIALGNVYPGMSANDLINVCGQPNSRDDDDWYYSDFKVEVERGIVEKVSTTGNAIATPNGVRVGQPAEALNSTYGTADKIDYDRDGTEYEYFSDDRSKKIEFDVVNGIITKITCKIRD